MLQDHLLEALLKSLLIVEKHNLTGKGEES